MFWFDNDQSNTIFGDKRVLQDVLCDGRGLNISPDVQIDFVFLPFCDSSFKLVVFDPPHLVKLGKNSWMAKKYGVLDGGWRQSLEHGFRECFRVLEEFGILIFKWNELDIAVKEVLGLVEYKPLFGHISGKRSNTHWITFMKYASMFTDLT